MIDGVQVKPLKKIPDERGYVAHMLRCDDLEFKKFGEVYFSAVYPGVIKGWHFHTEMTLNYAVIHGMIKLVLYDNRSDSKTKGKFMELFIGDLQYVLVTIPPMIWNGFQCISTVTAIVANCSTVAYYPNEMQTMDIMHGSIDYDWDIKAR